MQGKPAAQLRDFRFKQSIYYKIEEIQAERPQFINFFPFSENT